MLLNKAVAVAAIAVLGSLLGQPARTAEVPDKTVVLTFDDAVKSQATWAAPLLKELGFGATFFVTPAWMSDTANFMSWQDVVHLHKMGFEIGNHSWTHSDFSIESGKKLGEELELLDKKLVQIGIPRPVSFAYPTDTFGPEALDQLRKRGYRLARRGSLPELPVGGESPGHPGPALDITRNDPLLIPLSGNSLPYWDMETFKTVVQTARNGRIAVLLFHGVPDVVHPFCSTSTDQFRAYMSYLKDNGYHVIAMRDLLKYYDPSHPPRDTLRPVRYSMKALQSPGAIDSRLLALLANSARGSDAH